MTSLTRGFALLVLIGSFVLSAPMWLVAQDKKDDPPPEKKDPFKLQKKDPKTDSKDGDPPADKDPFKLKKNDSKDPDPFKLKKPDADPFKLKKKDAAAPDKKDNKDDKVKLPPAEDYPYFVQSVEAKILRINGANQDEFTIEVQLVDPIKVAKFQEWQAEQSFKIASAKTPKEQFDRTMDYQKDLPKRQIDIYTPKQYDVRAAEKIKVRSMDPPQEFDDKGFLKQWTQKELTALRGNTKLPGYPVTLEVVRANQKVHAFLVPGPKSKEKKKRAEDDPPAPKEMPEVVLLVIHSQQ